MSMPSAFSKKSLCLSIAVASVFSASLGAAQLEEVVVTAQKRSQSLQDVALSVSAVAGENIDRLDLDNVTSLATMVPNLNAMDNAAGNPSFRIRGVGLNDFSAAFDSPVGIHLDETFLFKPVLASLGFFDVARVEALKGPQGTVFGRNTTGGAVNFYSHTPSDEFEAGVKLSYGRYQRFEGEAFVSGALSDQLNGRLAVQIKDYADDEGPWLNLYDNKRLGQLEQQQLRGMLEWSDEQTKVLFTAEYGSKEGDLTPYDNLFQSQPGAHSFAAGVEGQLDPTKIIREPKSRNVFNADYSQSTDSEIWGLRLRVDHELEIGSLTSLTSFKDFERENTEDSDNTPIRSVNIDWNSKLSSFSQELRLAGEAGKLTYLIGAYYEDDTTEIVELVDSRDFLGSYFGDDYQVDTRSWALFSNNEYALNDQLSLVFGLRYTEETVEINGEGYLAAADTSIQSFSRVLPADRQFIASANGKRSDEDLNWKLGLNYYPSEDVLLYSSVSTGFRSGGFEMSFGGLALGNTLLTFAPEDVLAGDLGIKTTLLDGAMNLNAALFYTKVDDYQDNISQGSEVVPRRRNVGTLETQGLEVDLQWQLSDSLMVQWGLGYTDAEVTESDGVVDGVPLQGTTPVNTPEWSTSLLINHQLSLGDDLLLDSLISAQWQDERYLEPENSADHLVEAYHTIDASIALMPEDASWSLSLWGKNLTDEDYLLYINDVPAFLLFLPIRAEPRTFGISAEYNF